LRAIRLFSIGAKSVAVSDHEETFVVRYDELLRWAERLCDGQIPDAEDLLQDAFIEFVRRRPAVEDIQDLDAYLRTMLRNMHVSGIRRSHSLKRGGRSCVDFECLELAVAGIDPRSAWDRRLELELLCRYACSRKETSKSASVLILRFFHDYLPSEVARLMRSNRRAVDEWLRLARGEARRFLENPGSLDFGGPGAAAGMVALAVDSPASADIGNRLRRTVFAHRTGWCLSRGEIDALYAPSNTETLSHATLSHLVSCPACLSSATRAAGLAPLEDRLPPADGGGTGPGVRELRPAARKNQLRASLRRAQARVDEQRPSELIIAANGFEVSSQTVQPGHNEHTVRPNIGAEIGFVELFSETGTRLAYLEIQPPPQGAIEQCADIETSDGRRISLRVRFDQPWPEIQATYDDPELDAVPLPEAPSAPPEPRPRFAVALRAWFRPALALASLAVLLLVAGLLVHRQRTDVPAVSAATLIRDAETRERTLGNRHDRIVHRVLEFEDRLVGAAAVVQRYRIETWNDGEKQARARRVYDEAGALAAGEWGTGGNPVTIFERGAKPDVTLEPARPQSDQLRLAHFGNAPWRFTLSAAEFRTLIAPYLRQATFELTSLEGEPVYLLRVTSREGPLQSAVLVLVKADLHPLQMVLVMRTPDGVHEYRYRERGFALLDRSGVPDVFHPQVRSSRLERSLSPGVPLLPVSADPVELEAEAWYLMHQAGACTGEQTGIGWNPDGRLEIRAVVSDEARKKQLLDLLEPLRATAPVDFSVLTVGPGGEASLGTSRGAADPLIARAGRDALVRMPAYPFLRARFAREAGTGIDARIAEFADAVVSSSDHALAQAWALAQVAEWADSRHMESLAGRSQSWAQEMLRSHARDFRLSAVGLRTLLEQAVPAEAEAQPRSDPLRDSTTLIESARALLKSVSAQNAAVHAAFAPSTETQTVAEVPDATWLVSLVRLEARASRIERHGLDLSFSASRSGRRR
jgi:RNA polymerase sigma factor (sigma-70 family)